MRLPAPFPGPAPIPARRNATPIEQALGMAAEYRRTAAEEGDNHARCIQLESDISGVIGRVRDGRVLLPRVVADAMGRRDLALPEVA